MAKHLSGWLITLPLAALSATTSAQSFNPPAEALGWDQLDYAADGTCEADVRSNGLIYQVNAIGLAESAQGRLYLTNADMKPIDRSIRTNGSGQWQDYYLPFLANRKGGTVAITITTEACTLDLTFDWKRGVPVIGSDGERTIVGSEDWPEPLDN